MPFPIEFVKKNGDYDFFSPIVNITCNAAVVAVGGTSVAALSYVALKALGFKEVATISATAIPLAVGVMGVGGVAAGVGAMIYIASNFKYR